jgi:hypothetical protein
VPGDLSPEGYYLDSFDLERFLVHVLSIDGPSDTVILVDGVFLQRPELADLWDATIWARPTSRPPPGAERNLVWFDSPDAKTRALPHRYMPAQQRYIEEQLPRERATFVLRNVREPELVRQQRPR